MTRGDQLPAEPTAVDDVLLERVVSFHGHMCPGLAMGIQAARIALLEIGPHAQDEEVVAAVETDMCAVDAIQFLTGCTFGKGNLVHRDFGKNAYTFWRRSDGRAVRISSRPGAWQRDPRHMELYAKLRGGEATPDEAAEYGELHVRRAHELLERDPYELYLVTPVDDPPPRRSRIFGLVVCASCGEETMEIRIHRYGDRELCAECFEFALSAS